ncbi:hypothetical protein DSO57_1009536 [Entomophthora muscae]|uniref:Uncharacterized protein n=1 Tax=Entomophthora muscae TaxID=34485 RepID=A0ACC2RLL6_9FUNG|nr:hypothetical protein DSO57_1009536 [Entomophthora muscae]
MSCVCSKQTMELPWFTYEEILQYVETGWLREARLVSRRWNEIAIKLYFRKLVVHWINDVGYEAFLTKYGKYSKQITLSWPDGVISSLTAEKLYTYFPNTQKLVTQLNSKDQVTSFKQALVNFRKVTFISLTTYIDAGLSSKIQSAFSGLTKLHLNGSNYDYSFMKEFNVNTLRVLELQDAFIRTSFLNNITQRFPRLELLHIFQYNADFKYTILLYDLKHSLLQGIHVQTQDASFKASLIFSQHPAYFHMKQPMSGESLLDVCIRLMNTIYPTIDNCISSFPHAAHIYIANYDQKKDLGNHLLPSLASAEQIDFDVDLDTLPLPNIPFSAASIRVRTHAVSSWALKWLSQSFSNLQELHAGLGSSCWCTYPILNLLKILVTCNCPHTFMSLQKVYNLRPSTCLLSTLLNRSPKVFQVHSLCESELLRLKHPSLTIGTNCFKDCNAQKAILYPFNLIYN